MLRDWKKIRRSHSDNPGEACGPGLTSETSLVGMSHDEKQQVVCPTLKVTVPLKTSSHLGSYFNGKV